MARPGSQVVKGKVLMEFHRSTTFSASRDVHNLISLLEQNLGMSKSSMYNRSEFDQTKTWKQTRGVDFYAKRQFMRLPEAERNEKCAEYSRIHENLESAGQRVTITNLQESGNGHLYSFFIVKNHCLGWQIDAIKTRGKIYLPLLSVVNFRIAPRIVLCVMIGLFFTDF